MDKQTCEMYSNLVQMCKKIRKMIRAKNDGN